jgi:hypothetical protein
MEINGCVSKCEKIAIGHKASTVAAMCILLSGSAANVCAQSIAKYHQSVESATESGMNGFETSLTRQNPPAIFPENNIRDTTSGESASNRRIIVDHAITRADPVSSKPTSFEWFAETAEGALAKIAATQVAALASSGTLISVTLWDEITPPQAPAPVDTAEQPMPGDVANTGTQRTP